MDYQGTIEGSLSWRMCSRVVNQIWGVTPLGLVYAYQQSGQSPSFGSSHLSWGSYVVNVATGASQVLAPFSRLNSVIIHGACMMAAWLFIFPLGVLLARHKWLFEGKEWREKAIWFHLHRTLQLFGLVFFVVGTTYAHLYLDRKTLGKPSTGGLGSLSSCISAHQLYSCVVIGMCGMQLLFGFFRPHPEPSMIRTLWELPH